MTLFVSALVLTNTSSCGDDDGDCRQEPYPLMGEVALAALQNPESFDSFIAQNREQLDGQFQECMQQRIALYARIAEEERATCDEVYTFGSDFWHDCIEDVEQSYDLGIIFMNDILRSINGTPFAQTDYGGLLILYKQLDPTLYNQAVQLNAQILNEVTDTCEICD